MTGTFAHKIPPLSDTERLERLRRRARREHGLTLEQHIMLAREEMGPERWAKLSEAMK